MGDNGGKLNFVIDFGKSQHQQAGRLLGDFANESDADAAEREIVGASVNNVRTSVAMDHQLYAQVEMVAFEGAATIAGSCSHSSSVPRSCSKAQRACSATFVS